MPQNTSNNSLSLLPDLVGLKTIDIDLSDLEDVFLIGSSFPFPALLEPLLLIVGDLGSKAFENMFDQVERIGRNYSVGLNEVVAVGGL